MTTTEALEFAIDLLRRQAEQDRGALRIYDMAPPTVKPKMDRHALTRFRKCQDAIEILATMKRSQEEHHAV